MKYSIGFLALSMTLVGCGQATTLSNSLDDAATVAQDEQSTELSEGEVLALYSENQEAIDLVWTGLMSPETTLRQATEQWVAYEKPAANDVVVAIYSQNQEAINALWLEMGEETTLSEATLAWLVARS